MDDRATEERVRRTLGAVATHRAVVGDPPPLPAERPPVRSGRGWLQGTAAAACVALVAGVAVVALRSGADQEVHTAGGAPASTSEAGDTEAEPPRGAELMARLRDAEGAEHELWAYSADGACVVQTRLADGTRSIAGHDCGAGPECADEAWVEFATIPPGSFSCDGARIGEGLRPGFVTMQARSSEPDEPVTISSRLGADVASWEIVPEDGPTVGPHEPLRHPGDPERAYLFATVERGWAGMDIITRDDAGDVIERQHFAR